jgi:hypothetical protein
MMPVEWPIAAEAADLVVDPAPAVGQGRLVLVSHDLFLDDRARLTEQERALMSAMLGALIDHLADEIRIGLPHDLMALAEIDRSRIVARLWRSGALDRPALIQSLLRRTDEQMIADACRTARVQRPNGRGAGGVVERLVGDGDAAVASAAMALAVARGRRRDRFGRMGLEYDDVEADEAWRLVHLVAVAMRHGLPGPSVAIDQALADAAERLYRRHDPARRIEARALTLAAAVEAARGHDDDFIVSLAVEGDAALLAAACAVRADISPDTAWTLLIANGARDAMLLARLAELRRPAAGALVAALAEPLAWGDPGDAIAWFDRPGEPDIIAARLWWRLPPAYRDGVAQIGGGNGQSLD